MRQGGTLAAAACGRCPAAGERLPWKRGARLILTLAVGSWGLVGLAVWYVSG
jgi:hypothetical protein